MNVCSMCLFSTVALSGSIALGDGPQRVLHEEVAPKAHDARPSGSTYAARIAVSSVFADLRCAKTIGVVTPKTMDEVYGDIRLPEEATDPDFRQLEALVEEKLAAAGYRPAFAEFSDAEEAVDLSRMNYLANAPLSNYELTRFRSYLRAMREPNLAATMDESYRLLWWRAFDVPVSVRVVRTESGATLVAKMLASAEGVEPGKLCVRIEKAISSAEFESLRACFADSSIWNTDYDERDTLRRGGSKWILEARKPNGYAFGKLRSPEAGPLFNCAMRLLEMSGLPKGKVY